jgi:hypothetical protein
MERKLHGVAAGVSAGASAGVSAGMSAGMSAGVRAGDLVRVLFRIEQLSNDTFQATVLESGNRSAAHGPAHAPASVPAARMADPQGELYYVVVVLSVYAFAIVMFIASFVKKSGQDHGISIYMRDLEKVARLEKRQEKFRLRLHMHHRDKKHRILGEDRAQLMQDHTPHRLLNKPTSVWSLVSLEDRLSMLGSIQSSVSAPPSPGLSPPSPALPPSSPVLAPAPLDIPPSAAALPPGPPVLPSLQPIATIPEVKIEACE